MLNDGMRKLNLKKARWMIREMQKGELSVWQIAKQQNVTPRHARRLRARFATVQQVRFEQCGCKPKPLSSKAEQLVLSAHAEYGFGALSLENVLKKRVSHNKIHAVLLKHGLAKHDVKKQKKRKWVRYERRHSNSLWHADWKDLEGKKLLVIEDDASRLVVGYGLFNSANAENSLQVFAAATAKWGLPKQLLTDNGSHFCNPHKKRDLTHAFHGGVAKAGVHHIFTRVKHPQCNGKNERVFQTIEKETKRLGSLDKAIAFYNTKRPHMSLRWEALETPLQAFNRKKRKK